MSLKLQKNMIQKIFLYSLFICFLSCFHNSKKTKTISEKSEIIKDSILSKKEIYKKIDLIISERIANRNKRKDSLSYYFYSLNPEDLFNDNEFKAITGKLLEYSYLEERNKGDFPPESFKIYNMSIVASKSYENSFILGIMNKSMKYTDFVCIDSIVLALDKIPEMQNDSIHRICIDLVKNNKTGGCKW